MTRIERAALAAAIVGGFVAYTVARWLAHRLDLDAWRRAWNAVPIEDRIKIRNTLLGEEGL